MEMTETMQLTKEQSVMELLELLRKNNMKEAANSIFEMASYVDVIICYFYLPFQRPSSFYMT